MKKELDGNIQIVKNVENWEKAIKIASEPLLRKNKIENRYIENMIKNIKKIGPYVILVPRVAMPHSRPEHGVLENGLSLLKINEGVYFSNKKDIVNLIFVLAAKDSDSHLNIILALTNFLENSEKTNNLINAKSIEEIYSLL